MAFSSTGLSNATEEELFDALGTPKIETLARIDGEPLEKGLPTQLVEAAKWDGWADEDDEDIRLIDFGESFLQGEEPEKLAQPGGLRVPETIFTDSFDYRLDLWRVGCTIFSFIFTANPFMYFDGDSFAARSMDGFAEKMPAE